MFDFEREAQRKEEWRKYAAQEFVPGIDPVELKPGQLVTISPNLMYCDRSFATEVLTIVAVNAAHVQVHTQRDKDKPITLLMHEHHFYLANDFETE